MDVMSIATTTVLTVVIMVALYHGWIIPTVVKGIEERLPTAIKAEVDTLLERVLDRIKTDISEAITEQGDVIMSKLYGAKGKNKQITQYATRYLERNGMNEDTIADAIERYGQPIVDAILKKSTADVGTPDPATSWK